MNYKWDFKSLLNEKIRTKGGWVNTHAHIDRAYTNNPGTMDIYSRYSLKEKWDYVDQYKRYATVQEYYDRMAVAVERMLEQGVKILGTFIDVDPVCQDKAYIAVSKIRTKFKDDIKIIIINQTLKGVIEPSARKWFDRAVDMVDIVGGLPKRDERDYGKGEKHMDIVLGKAKEQNKMVHLHVDQFNSPVENETELLCDKTIEHGMQGRVVAIHSISLAAHPKKYREKVYRKMKKAGVMVIACPMAWIDTQRSEDLLPFHNAITPVEELVPQGITVALGTDNICDYMLPFSDGNIWQELQLIAAGCRFMDVEALSDIATTNGVKILGLDKQESKVVKRKAYQKDQNVDKDCD